MLNRELVRLPSLTVEAVRTNATPFSDQDLYPSVEGRAGIERTSKTESHEHGTV